MNSKLPTSNLLNEADPQWSMAELFNRDVLSMKRTSPEDYQRLIAELRAQALRNAAAEAAGERIPRQAKAKDTKPSTTNQSLEDLI